MREKRKKNHVGARGIAKYGGTVLRAPLPAPFSSSVYGGKLFAALEDRVIATRALKTTNKTHEICSLAS